MVAAALALPPGIHLEPCVTVPQPGNPHHVVYGLQPKQLLAYRMTPLYRGSKGVRYLGYGGAAGGAKSHTARAIATAVASQWWGSTSIIFRKTEKEVKENHYQKFRTELPTHAIKDGRKVKFYEWNGSDRAFTFPHMGGSRILLGHLRRDDDVFKYQGNEYDCIIFEESTHYTWFMISWLLGNRLRATVPHSKPFAVFPSNPGNIGHQWYTRLFIRKDYREHEDPAQHAFVQSKLADNAILQARDPDYEKKLNRLPEPYRSWQRDGDFEAGAGSALPQLRRAIHLVKPFGIPDYWQRFGAFDWGYSHPWSFGEYAVSEDGDVYCLQTIRGRLQLPWDIAQRIGELCPQAKQFRYIAAGRDVFEVRKARGEGNTKDDNAPTLNEHFQDAGFRNLIKANTARMFGLENLRIYLAWDNTGPLVDGMPTPGDPALRFFDNASNRLAVDQLEAMVPDPDNPEDVLKVDADEMGDGGDDDYDQIRYACSSRPRKAPSVEEKKPIRAFDPAILKLEMDRGRKPDDTREKLPARRRQAPLHPEMGEYA